MKNGSEKKVGGLELNYACLVILFAILLGGGTEQNLWSDHLIQVLVAPLLLLGFYRLPTVKISGWIWLIFIASGLILISQFLSVHREFVLSNSNETITQLSWTGSPSHSIESALFFTTCLGLFIYISGLSMPAKIKILKVILIAVLIQAILGAFQLSYSSTVRVLGVLPFTITSGLFANENHFSTLLFATIPILGFIYLGVQDNPKLYLFLSALVILLLFAIGSRAGMAFAIVQFILSLIWLASKNLSYGVRLALFASCAFMGVLAMYFLDFSSALQGDQRVLIFENTWNAIQDHWVYGSGLGTFVLLYPSYEPAEQVFRNYVNHAHNDYLELGLELGVIFLIPLFIFVFCVVKRIFSQNHVGILGIALMAILAHSFVDYPLRTFSIAVMFAIVSAVIFHNETQKRDKSNQ